MVFCYFKLITSSITIAEIKFPLKIHKLVEMLTQLKRFIQCSSVNILPYWCIPLFPFISSYGKYYVITVN